MRIMRVREKLRVWLKNPNCSTVGSSVDSPSQDEDMLTVGTRSSEVCVNPVARRDGPHDRSSRATRTRTRRRRKSSCRRVCRRYCVLPRGSSGSLTGNRCTRTSSRTRAMSCGSGGGGHRRHPFADHFRPSNIEIPSKSPIGEIHLCLIPGNVRRLIELFEHIKEYLSDHYRFSLLFIIRCLFFQRLYLQNICFCLVT